MTSTICEVAVSRVGSVFIDIQFSESNMLTFDLPTNLSIYFRLSVRSSYPLSHRFNKLSSYIPTHESASVYNTGSRNKS